jgi:hypothetical protein
LFSWILSKYLPLFGRPEARLLRNKLPGQPV